jgi:hypothetical protein
MSEGTLRPLGKYAKQSSARDITDAEGDLDESGGTTELIIYASALVRSDRTKNVAGALDRLAAVTSPDGTQQTLVAFLKVLALYRLRRDDEAIREAEKAVSGGFASTETQEILRELRQAKEDAENAQTTGIIAGIGLAAVAIVGVAATLLFRPKRK